MQTLQFKNLIADLISEIITEAPSPWDLWKTQVEEEFARRNPRAIRGTKDYATMNMALKKYINTPDRPTPEEFLNSLGFNNTNNQSTDPHMPTYPGKFNGQVYTTTMGFDTKRIFFTQTHLDQETGEETTRRFPRDIDQQITRSYVWDAGAKKWLRGNKLPRNPVPSPPAVPTTNTKPPAPLRGPRPPDQPTHEPKVVRRRPS